MSTEILMSLADIREEIGNLRNRFKSNPSPYRAKINQLLTEFDGFARSYETLWSDLSVKVSQGEPNPAAGEAIDMRLTELWWDLQEVVNQYRNPSYSSKVEDGMKYLETLSKSNTTLFPTTQPIPDVLIFIKREGIRNIARKYPFTNTFFIGISELSANNDPGKDIDWKPIAHELGHYFYWNNCFKTKGSPNFAEVDEEPVFSMDIEQALQTEEKLSLAKETRIDALAGLIGSWSEEIFADVVGTSLLGRDYLVSSESLFIEEKRNQQKQPDQPVGIRFTDDIEHPIPYLRPFICAEALKLVEAKTDDLWSAFQKEIKSTFGENALDSEDVLVGVFSTDDQGPIGFEEVALDIPKLQNAIKTVVPLVYGLLQTKEPRTDQQTGIEFVKTSIEPNFLDAYIEAADVLEKGDGKGFLRKIKRLARRVIRIWKR